HGNQHAFDRRQHLNALAIALYRAEFLALADPAVEAGEFDGVNLAEEVTGKGVDSHASVLMAFVARPSVSGMEPITLWNFEAGALQHDGRRDHLRRRYLQGVRRLLRTAKVHDGKNQKKCK